MPLQFPFAGSKLLFPLSNHLWWVLIGADCQGPTVRDKLFVFIAGDSYAVTLTTSRKYELDSPTVR